MKKLSDSEREPVSSLLLEEEANDYKGDLTFVQRAIEVQKLHQ